MSHARQQIREQVATLVTGLATTGSRVHQSRMRPDTLPCLLVTTNDEEIVPGTVGDLRQRMLDLVITGYAKAGDTLDDTLDTIAAEVEVAIDSGYPKDRAELARIEVDFDDSLEKPVGSIALTYRITYFTAAGSPGTLI